MIIIINITIIIAKIANYSNHDSNGDEDDDNENDIIITVIVVMATILKFRYSIRLFHINS